MISQEHLCSRWVEISGYDSPGFALGAPRACSFSAQGPKIMANTHLQDAPIVLELRAATAADLMTPNPLSIRHDATMAYAASFLVKHEISAAPVVDDAGRAVGVISHTDVLRFDAEVAAKDPHDAEYYRAFDRRCPPAMREAVYGKKGEIVRACDVMTPVVVEVATDDSAVAVVAKLLALKIHRLFVADSTGTLVGVISTSDVLRCLHRAGAKAPAPAFP
jgi:CBS domain-containing protein